MKVYLVAYKDSYPIAITKTLKEAKEKAQEELEEPLKWFNSTKDYYWTDSPDITYNYNIHQMDLK